MVSITATSLDDLLAHDTTITDAQLESIIDMAIHCLNLYGADLPNLTGTSGSKTVSVESKQAGAILLVAQRIYYSFYKNLGTRTISPLSLTTPDLLANPAVLQSIKESARQLSEIEVDYG